MSSNNRKKNLFIESLGIFMNGKRKHPEPLRTEQKKKRIQENVNTTSQDNEQLGFPGFENEVPLWLGIHLGQFKEEILAEVHQTITNALDTYLEADELWRQHKMSVIALKSRFHKLEAELRAEKAKNCQLQLTHSLGSTIQIPPHNGHAIVTESDRHDVLKNQKLPTPFSSIGGQKFGPLLKKYEADPSKKKSANIVGGSTPSPSAGCSSLNEPRVILRGVFRPSPMDKKKDRNVENSSDVPEEPLSNRIEKEKEAKESQSPQQAVQNPSQNATEYEGSLRIIESTKNDQPKIIQSGMKLDSGLAPNDKDGSHQAESFVEQNAAFLKDSSNEILQKGKKFGPSDEGKKNPAQEITDKDIKSSKSPSTEKKETRKVQREKVPLKNLLDPRIANSIAKGSENREEDTDSESDEAETKDSEVSKNIRLILKDLALNNYTNFHDEMMSFKVSTEIETRYVIDLFFKKARRAVRLSDPLAMWLASIIHSDSDEFDGYEMVLQRCKKDFLYFNGSMTRKNVFSDEIAFIGSLYKQNVLPEPFIHECIRCLIELASESAMKCLCKLLDFVGDDDKFRKDTDYFGKMQKIADEGKLAKRVITKINDIINNKSLN